MLLVLRLPVRFALLKTEEESFVLRKRVRMSSITSSRSSASSMKEAEEIGKQYGGKWRACEITETFF